MTNYPKKQRRCLYVVYWIYRTTIQEYSNKWNVHQEEQKYSKEEHKPESQKKRLEAFSASTSST